MDVAEAGQVSTEAAEVYEQFFVPALFGQFAPLVAEAAGAAPGQRSLDVACGTGVLAREMHRRTTPGGRAAGLDCNAGHAGRGPSCGTRRRLARGEGRGLAAP